MSITFTLQINQLRVVQLNNQPNTVCQVDYEYVGLNDDNKAHSYIGTERLNTEDVESFVSFEQLTEETVVGWLEAAWSDTHYEHMREQINTRFAAPIVTSQSAPWLPTYHQPADHNP